MDERYTEREKIAMRKKRRQRKRRRIFILSCFVLCSVSILLVIFKAPFFKIEKIVLKGEKILTESQIVKQSEIVTGSNIFSMSMSKTEGKIKELAYVKEVNVRRVFPDIIEIIVKECQPVAYIAVDKKYALIDSAGKILEMPKTNDKYKVMTVKGINLKSPTVGNKIENDGDERIKYCIDALAVMEECKMIDKVCQLDLSKLTGIKINYDNRVYANCGSYGGYESFKNKLLTLNHLINESISEVEKVEVDLTMENIVIGPYEDEATKKKRLEKEKAEKESNNSIEDKNEEESEEKTNQSEEDEDVQA